MPAQDVKTGVSLHPADLFVQEGNSTVDSSFPGSGRACDIKLLPNARLVAWYTFKLTNFIRWCTVGRVSRKR